MAFLRVKVVTLDDNAGGEAFRNAEKVVNVDSGQQLLLEKETHTENTWATGVEEGQTYDVYLKDIAGYYPTHIEAPLPQSGVPGAVFRIEAANTVGQTVFDQLFEDYNQGQSKIENLQDAVNLLNMCSAVSTSEMLGGQTAAWPNLDLSSWKLPNIANSGAANLWNGKADNTGGVTEPQFGTVCDGSEPGGPSPTPPAAEPPVRDGDLMLVHRGDKSYQAEIKYIQSALMPLDLRTLPPLT